MHGQLGQGELALGRSQVLEGLTGGVGQDQRHGVSRADILHGRPDQAPGDEQGFFPPLKHAGQPVEGGVRI